MAHVFGDERDRAEMRYEKGRAERETRSSLRGTGTIVRTYRKTYHVDVT